MISLITIAALEREPKLAALLEAYATESSIAGMPRFNPQLDTYRQLEAAGVLHVFAAHEGEELVGFLCLLVSAVPHYGVKIATTESYFVAPEHRKNGAGLRLLREAEGLARDLGAAGMLVSAPAGGRLAQVLEAMPSYRETNRVFFKGLGHD
jgi:GNAT superfamily N-acetyltransferase